MAALDVLLSVGSGRNNLKAAYNLQADMIASPIFAPRPLDPGASQKCILTAMFLPEVASGLDHDKYGTSLIGGVVLISLQKISHITHWTLELP